MVLASGTLSFANCESVAEAVIIYKNILTSQEMLPARMFRV
jgi:hypothetical protein